MAWYLRRALRLGPVRFNVSKRGIGASVGVKGARVGLDAKGEPYVAGGRGGIYVRERIRGHGELWLVVLVVVVVIVAVVVWR